MVAAADIINARILIVDDQEANVRLLELTFRGAGYLSVASTMHPSEVSGLHKQNRYDLIVLDLEMPGMDGFQVMKGLKEVDTGGYLPVLVVTAQPAHKLRALQAGAKDFVSKPFDLVEVVTRARNMIEVRLLHMETSEQARKLAQTLREVEESRQRTDGLIGSAMDAIISVNADQQITLYNAAAQRMFQHAPSDILGKPLDVLIPQRYRHKHRQHVVQFDDTGVTSRSMSSQTAVSGLRADGEEFPIEASISQIEISGRKIFTVILRDITERVQTQEEIQTLNTDLERRVARRTIQLQAANNELEAFSYSVSHDLRAPLRGIDGWSQALLEDYGDCLDITGRQYLDRVRSETQRMGRLIDDMLELARVMRAEMHTQSVDLTTLAEDVVARLREQYPAHPVEIEIAPHLVAEGDARLLEIVLTNLLGNAFKFTTRSANPHVEFGQTEHEGKKVFFIRDNGAGFDMTYAAKLFGAFHRMHKASEFQGSGVGLATVQRIVNRHGGSIWAEAALERGATFSFTLKEAV